MLEPFARAWWSVSVGVLVGAVFRAGTYRRALNDIHNLIHKIETGQVTA